MVKRRYRAPLREAQARMTRTVVLEAAHRSFVARGYQGTSVRDVARAARVSEQTVYRLFGTKAGLLNGVLLAAISGGDLDGLGPDQAELLERIRAGATPEARLHTVATWLKGSYERGVADIEAVVAAAAEDPKLARFGDFVREQRYRDVRAIVEAVMGPAARHPGLDMDRLTDAIYALTSGDFVRQLVSDRGWTTAAYVDWFEDVVRRVYLDRLDG